MKAPQRIGLLGVLLTATFVAAVFASSPATLGSQRNTREGKIFAQKLVEATHAKHPEADEIGISAVTSHGCMGIASTDKGDIGEKCEKDDSEPMRTGKPFVEKEKDGFDVSLPLHDSLGKLVGSVGIGFKPAADQTTASVTEEAQKIASEMQAQIPSKSSLFRRSR